jgi:hypothetical protein
MRMKIGIAAAVMVLVSGCANVAGMAGEGIGGMVGNVMGTLLDKPIEVTDNVKKVATIEDAKWRQPASDTVAYAFTFSVPKGCKAVVFSGKAYNGQTVVGDYSSMGVQGTTNIAPNSKVFVSRQLFPSGRASVTRFTLDSFGCGN